MEEFGSQMGSVGVLLVIYNASIKVWFLLTLLVITKLSHRGQCKKMNELLPFLQYCDPLTATPLTSCTTCNKATISASLSYFVSFSFTHSRKYPGNKSATNPPQRYSAGRISEILLAGQMAVKNSAGRSTQGYCLT